MRFTIPTPDPVSLAVKGSEDRFPVRRIYCIGKNYADHVAEMGGDVKSSPPVVFTKSRETLVESGASIPFPPETTNLHHEVEWVVALGPDGIWGHAVGLDMTRRDMQADAKTRKGPWDLAKNFDHSAPCGPLTRNPDFDTANATIALTVNGKTRQTAPLSNMIWTIGEIIDRLSASITLEPGDLIFTGTPAGVGPVVPGDHLVATLSGCATLDICYDRPDNA